MADDSDPATTRYEVVVLVERALDATDAARLQSLHEGVEEPVRYHVLLPVDDPAQGVDAAMMQLSSGDLLHAPAMTLPPEVGEEVSRELLAACRARVEASVHALQEAGAEATGRAATEEPLRAVVEAVRQLDAREVIIVTRPHVVQEFFHVDWTSRAERRLDVPVLHLLEHAGER